MRQFVNELPQASTVHWHGIRIANAMDGVPDLTQPATPSGKTFLYDFTAPDAGSYWYHPHNKAWEQMARGLYGALIVDEATPPDVDRDEVFLIDDWRLTREARIAENFGAMGHWSHGGRSGNWITVNGRSGLALPVRHQERMRLRLINTANARIFSLALEGLEGWIVALDGQPLPKPEPAGRLVLAPAQRIDLIADVTGPAGSHARLISFQRSRRQTQQSSIVNFNIADKARDRRLPQPRPLPVNPLPPLGPLDKARRFTLRMEGGAMGGMRSAIMAGRSMGIRELVGAGKVWAFNGLAEMPEKPFLAASAGETVRIAIVNDTAWPHAMHLHGHHFRQIGADNKLGPLRDTLLVNRRETAEIAFVADNPGDWLLHCHMLEHSVAGMKTWLRVS
jgi:FtsP/CotA-like multicopper oxidase with cupredoxin domain